MHAEAGILDPGTLQPQPCMLRLVFLILALALFSHAFWQPAAFSNHFPVMLVFNIPILMLPLLCCQASLQTLEVLAFLPWLLTLACYY